VPLGNDVDLVAIAEKYEFVGREIRNAVKKACVHAVSKDKDMIEMEDLVFACESILSERLKLEESRK
jgi:ATP-dependent 26S proteasome regulatory subunit